MSGEILAAELVAQQQHGPGGAAHLVLLAGAAITVIVILGVSRWRGRRDDATAEEHSTSHDRSAATTRTTGEE